MASDKVKQLASLRHARSNAIDKAPRMVDVTTGTPFPRLPDKLVIEPDLKEN